MEQEFYRKLDDGELIGSCKHYSCLPPTIHPETGRPYEWKIPLRKLPPVIDPVEAGLILPVELEQNKYPLDISNISRGTQQLGCVRGQGSLGGSGGNPQIEEVIGRTLPTGYGQRNHCLFRLARQLKAIPQFNKARAEELLPVVRGWWEKALPNIRTKAWGESWKDYVIAWERVRSSGAAALLTGIGSWVCGQTDDPLMRLELACEAIHFRQQGQRFFLGCRTAGELIGVGKSSAARFIAHLVKVGVLHVEVASDNANRMATTYSYRGPSLLSFAGDKGGDLQFTDMSVIR
jgi:hypothetical protein